MMIRDLPWLHSFGMAPVRGVLSVGLVVAAVQLTVGCSDESSSLGGNDPACKSHNWRQPTPQGVVCPGAEGCLCGAGQVCCIQVVNNQAVSGSCGALTECAGPALTCDGSEDCPTGQVCCLIATVGGGSECREPKDCFFSDELTTCRGDSECNGIERCEPSQPGSLLAGVVAACLL